MDFIQPVGSNIHGRPTRLVYVFNAITKSLITSCKQKSDAAKVIDKADSAVHYYIRTEKEINGVILSHSKELMEKHSSKII